MHLLIFLSSDLMLFFTPVRCSTETNKILGYSCSSDCGYCRKSRSGQSRKRECHLLLTGLSPTHPHPPRIFPEIFWLLQQPFPIPLPASCHLGTLARLGRPLSNTVCRLLLLCRGHVHHTGILPETGGSVLETIWDTSLPAEPEKLVLPPLHTAARFDQVQAHQGPTTGHQPFQQVCHWRGIQQGASSHMPSVPRGGAETGQ